jgi:MerR family transcriptional regulator, copper efflux regulator
MVSQQLIRRWTAKLQNPLPQISNAVLKYRLFVFYQDLAMGNLTIGKIAQQTGVGVETIRFYERKGLIAQPLKPQDGGYRIYSSEIVQKVRFIRQAQELGFSLREIKELLALRADPGSDCADIRGHASEKLEEVEIKIAQLEKIGNALRTVIASCPSRGALEGCSIIAAMESSSGNGN